MLSSLWNYIAGQILPAAGGLACVGAAILEEPDFAIRGW